MHYDTLTDLSRRIRTREVSPVDVVDACLARIDALNPELNAFITVMGDEARDRAREAEAELHNGQWRGPLHGVPVGVKDFYDTAGVRTTAGSEPFKERVPTADAEVVAKLQDAGAIIVGKTNMDALGMATTGLTGYFGPVRNPWNDDYVTGGSSAGSAAAVAAGLCYATVDSDAVGSVRIPAACCGVVGIKGTYGLVSVQGILGDEPVDDFIRWMGHAGVIARTPHDAALVLNTVAHVPGQDFTVGIGDADTTIRVGVGSNFSADPQIRSAFEDALGFLRGKGYTLTNAEVPFGAAQSFANIEKDRAEVAEHAFAEVDVVVLTTLEAPVPTVRDTQKDPEQGVSAEGTAFANYYGLPALTVPCGFDPNGLPVGLQIVGWPGGEQGILNVAQQCATMPTVRASHPRA